MEWKARTRKYGLEKQRLNYLQREEVIGHPLKATIPSQTTSTTSRTDTSYITKNHSAMKLSNNKKPTFEDPLSRFAAESSFQNDEKSDTTRRASNDILANDLMSHVTNEGKFAKDDGIESWSQKQSQILSTFTTSQKLSLVALSNKKEIATKTLPTSISEKVKTRLEQLDELEEGFEHETLSLSQEEYVSHINKLGASLISAWKDDQRVKTLKIAIQCTKLLGDTSSKQFYPSKFVIVTEILDNFGHLVFERLLEKAISSSSPGQRHIISITNIDPDMISDTAKETCRNWFYKIASIRELLPRIYIEASILRCFDFLDKGAAECALERLMGAARGAAEPLVAAYLRCYLARVGDCLSDSRTMRKNSYKKYGATGPSFGHGSFPVGQMKITPTYHLLESLNDTIASLLAKSFSLESTNKIKYRDSESKVLRCFSPALEWMTRCLSKCVIAQGLTFDHFDSIFESFNKCRDHSLRSLVIGCLTDQLPHSYIAQRAVEIKDIISELDLDDEEIADLYCRLGSSLVKGFDPAEEERRPLLNDVWRTITSFERPQDYATCARVWSSYVARHFGRKEVNVVMGDVVRKLTPDRAFESEQASLKVMMGNFIDCSKLPLRDLVALSNFLPFLDVLEGEAKVSVCKDILGRYSKEVFELRSGERENDLILSDPVVTHTFMTLCRCLHDQVSATSIDDEVRLIGRLISNFIGTVRKENNSAQLQFYVECRSMFCNIDPVLMDLVHKVNRLSMKKSGKGHDGSFLRACSAYNFITIPSLNGVFHRLNLYLISGQVALQNGCLSQADSFFGSVVQLVACVPRLLEMDGKVVHTEGMLVEFIRNLCSGLLVLPDPPDRPPLYHFKELVAKIESYSWDQRYDSKVPCHLGILLSLSSQSQTYLPYKISGVDSNDTLYGSDPKFLAEVSKLSSEILSKIVRHLDSLEDPRAAIVAVSVIEQLLCHSDLTLCASFFRSVWASLGLGQRKINVTQSSQKNTSDHNSVSINISRVVEMVKKLAKEEPEYDRFLALVIS